MRKFIALLCILTLVFSLNIFAKDAFSFEPYEYADSFVPLTYEGMAPFVTGYRDSREEDYSVVEGEKWWHGSHSVQMRLTHNGTKWNILAKAHHLNQSDPQNIDTTFLIGLDNRDTIYYYLYVPWNAHIDSIFIFIREASWMRDEYTIYRTRDLRYGCWNELKDGISDNFNGEPFDVTDSNIVQSDFEIHTSPAVNPPACTLYWDCPSSKGKIPGKYADTTGQAGIEMPQEGALNVAKASINCVEYNINVTTPVMVQVYDLTGRKQEEMPIGIQPAGNYRIPLDLAAGVYITIVTAGEEIKSVKTICVK